MTNQVEMFGDGPSKKLTKLKLAEGGAPLWTAEKASLIDEYIHRFLLVTKHGVYLDLFAGPQRADDLESWSVRRVLVRRTEGSPSIRHYAVCDEDPAQVEGLRELGGGRSSFRVYVGDVFAIHEKGEGSRTMYYMIHASDHPRAATLMSEAYREVGSSRMMGGVQLELLPGIQ